MDRKILHRFVRWSVPQVVEWWRLRLITQTDLLNAPVPGFEKVRDRVFDDIRDAIRAVCWPEGAETFTIFDQSGKKRGEGSGVKPIKDAFVRLLIKRGWEPEFPFPISDEEGGRPGKIDAALKLPKLPPFAVEWETGNISSSHRAMNKMALGLIRGILSGGILVLPTRKLYYYLTDRIGNYEELQPYFSMWSALPAKGYLGVIAVEHDGVSKK